MQRREHGARLDRVPERHAVAASRATAAWLAVPVLAGSAQLLRGATEDALIFLLPAAVLAADALGLLPRPRPRAAPSLLAAATSVVAVVLALTPRHGVLDAVALVGLGVAVLVAAWPDPPRQAPGPARPRSIALWAGCAVALGLWELASFVLGRASRAASVAHPVISDVLDLLAQQPAGRALLAAAWLVTGLALLARGRRP